MNTPVGSVGDKTVRYKNPWHNPHDRMSKEYFETNVRPAKYKGYLIYHRIRSNAKGGDCYDVVRDGVCLIQMAGPNGARMAIDTERWKNRSAAA